VSQSASKQSHRVRPKKSLYKKAQIPNWNVALDYPQYQLAESEHGILGRMAKTAPRQCTTEGPSHSQWPAGPRLVGTQISSQSLAITLSQQGPSEEKIKTLVRFTLQRGEVIGESGAKKGGNLNRSPPPPPSEQIGVAVSRPKSCSPVAHQKTESHIHRFPLSVSPPASRYAIRNSIDDVGLG